MKRLLMIVCAVLLAMAILATPALAATASQFDNAISKGADRLVAIQGPNSGPYPYNWEWVAGNGDYTSPNLQGITAIGLLAAYEKTGTPGYLTAAANAGNSLVTRYDGLANDWSGRPFGTDVEFLVRLSAYTGNPSYASKAHAYFENRVVNQKSAKDLADYYIDARLSLSGWDLSSRIRAAWATGFNAYANGIVTELLARSADWVGILYGGVDYTNVSYGSLLWAFSVIGYTGSEVANYRTHLLNNQNPTNGSWDSGGCQTTAYVILGFLSDGGPGTKAAVSKACDFLLGAQTTGGGWLDTGYTDEYPEVGSEVLMALVAAYPKTVMVYDEYPSWTATHAGGVYSAYYTGPYGSRTVVSPGSTQLYDGREAGIIKAGMATSEPWDEGLFGFRPSDNGNFKITIDDFAALPCTYDVENQYGACPVWITIVVGDLARTSTTTYQFVPTTNPSGWHTVDAGAGMWQKWNNDEGDVSGNPPISLSQIAADNSGQYVVRAYLRLGMGIAYHDNPHGTQGWVDKATLGGVTYDFVVLEPGQAVPELPSWALFALGLAAIATIIVIKKRRAAATSR